MRFSILTTTIILVCTVSVNADHHTINSGYSAGLTLNDYDTLLMTGGGLHDLDIYDYSQATIQGTTPLIEGGGGIWMFIQAGYSYLNFSGGEVHEFNIHSASRAVFSGGRIDNIRSYQHVEDIPVGDPPVWVPDPHIEFFCHDHDWNDTTNILTGTWFDDSTFDIQLVDVEGYSPTIENIFFTPEPATFFLISIGGVFIRRCRYGR